MALWPLSFLPLIIFLSSCFYSCCSFPSSFEELQHPWTSCWHNRSRSWYKLRSRSSDADCCWLRVYTGVNWGDHCAGVKVDGNCTSVLYPVQRHMLLTFIEASYMQISTDFLLEQAKNVCGLLPSRRRRTDLLDGFNSAYSVVVALLILL
jgi:hypothetical protein